MTFTTPCFVRVENPEKRKELIEWLEWIGYRLEYLRNDGVIVLTSENRVYVYGEAVHEIIKNDYDAIDCGENTELFKALAAMMDGPECTEQYLMATANLYVLKRGKVKQLAAKGELLHSDVIVKCGGVFSSLRKATAEEIVEYFKNKEL
ncbi:hypothetical protein [Alistipes indistinctus]|uniref:hypothetical protein n=1 Tax=Alistipes indistinctus TaxID=626932 RepID=UPI003AB5C691